MDIMFGNNVVGEIVGMYREEQWVHGNFTPSKFYYEYKEFFEAMVCEDGMDETKFDNELFDENNWFLKSEKGLQGISIPAIYSDGDISFRYR